MCCPALCLVCCIALFSTSLPFNCKRPGDSSPSSTQSPHTGTDRTIYPDADAPLELTGMMNKRAFSSPLPESIGEFNKARVENRQIQYLRCRRHRREGALSPDPSPSPHRYPILLQGAISCRGHCLQTDSRGTSPPPCTWTALHQRYFSPTSSPPGGIITIPT